MAFTVLKVSKIAEKEVDVIGEFETEEQAFKFADDSRLDDLDNEYEFIIESPPSYTPN